MEERIPSIDDLFRDAIGLPAWNVKQGVGSFLTFEFGEPHLKIREPRDIPDADESVRELI